MNRTDIGWMLRVGSRLLVLSLASMGCPEEGDEGLHGDVVDTSGENALTELDLDDPEHLALLCENPENYDGLPVKFSGDLIEEKSVQTTAGCDANECCGNAVWVTFTIPCPGDALVLGAAAQADFPVAQGRVDYPAGSNLEELITQSSTTFGCVGQECALECTPARASDIASGSATFRFDASRPAFDVPSEETGAGAYRLKLEVEAINLRN